MIRNPKLYSFVGLATAVLVLVAASQQQEEGRRVAEIVRQASSLSTKGLIETRAAIEESILTRLLEADPQLKNQWADFSAAPDCGLNKLVNRGIIGNTVTLRGGGAYFSFVSQSNCYNKKPQLELQNFCFSSGFYGGSDGVVIKLDTPSVRDANLADCPAVLTEPHQKPVDMLRNLEREIRRSRQALDTKAQVGSVFAVRWASGGEADTLAAFEVVAMDDWTVTIAWRILKNFDIPTR